MPAPFSLHRSAAWAMIALSSATLWLPRASQAQAVPPRVVSVCSGVALPRSVVTDIMTPVVTGIAGPTETRVNSILGVIQIIPLVGQVLPPLTLNATGLLTAAGTGQNITLSVLDVNGQVVGPNGACDNRSDTFSLTTPGGLSMGGRDAAFEATGPVQARFDRIGFGDLALKQARGDLSLDVVKDEPLPPDSPLWDVPNLVITPHAAGGRPVGVEERLAHNVRVLLGAPGEMIGLVKR